MESFDEVDEEEDSQIVQNIPEFNNKETKIQPRRGESF